tara:strand:- start:1484 stop:2896 length:1413 start_codon:yes stop_codon:yes gene_type:complete
METRFPFRYGIASMTRLPHLFLRVTLSVDGKETQGICSEGLPPKWFTKNPDTTFEEDLPDLVGVIQQAAAEAQSISSAKSIYDLWNWLYESQTKWAAESGIPPLLANLGVSLIERGMMDAFCRSIGKPFWAALHHNDFGINLGEIHPELPNAVPADFLPAEPLQKVNIRHTVGLGDALIASEIPPEDLAADGLPQALEDCIREYHLRYFKIKLSGNLEVDRERLFRLADLLKRTSPDFRYTLDGNEQYRDLGAFRAAWEAFQEDPQLQTFLSSKHLIFVEQPLHRDAALEAPVAEVLKSWRNAPPMVIDESDGELGSLRRALELGYSGTSYKSCKGVIKGIANACLLAHLRRQAPDCQFLMSGEDLATVGPVTLLQDLAVMAALGISHVERNGHHYFKGLSAFPVSIQETVNTTSSGLYHSQKERDFSAFTIRHGQVDLADVNDASFGTGLDPSSDEVMKLLGAPGWPQP